MFRKFFVLFFLSYSTCATCADGLPTQNAEADVNDFVIGGRKAQEGKYPFMASIQFKDKDGVHPICGGSILSPRWILTAAHCGVPFKSVVQYMNVCVGNTDLAEDSTFEQIRAVQDIITHENYKNNQIGSDVALFKLSQPLVFNQYVRHIELPSAGSAPVGEALILGWGDIESKPISERKDNDDFSTTKLHVTEIQIVSNDYCREEWKRALHLFQCMDHILCVGMSNQPQQACDGDSGGPLVQYQNGRPVVQGVLSMGNATCTAAPSIYMKTSTFFNWITEKMQT